MRDRETEEPGRLDTDAVKVRTLAESDLDAIVRIDAHALGRARKDFYRDKVSAALRDSRLRASLMAEIDGLVVGFLMAKLHYGEFGQPEPIAVIDALGVHPDFRGRKVGKALLRQFVMNLEALGVERIRTEVRWDDGDLVGFFAREGFAPAPFLVLEKALGPRRGGSSS
jgi:ribosomal protein S18 acetylase RimI-like enzyme